MALKEQELQGYKNQEVSRVDDDEAATVKCSLGSTRVVLSSLVDLPDDLEGDEFMTAWGVAVAISRGMREDQITAGDKWLARFPGLCEEQVDSSSAVQAAARLLARAFSDSAASLNHLYLLAAVIERVPAKELALPLGLLFRFIAVRSTQLVVKQEQFSFGTALVYLRAVELFTDHVRHVRYLNDVHVHFENLQFYFMDAAASSVVILIRMGFSRRLFPPINLNNLSPQARTLM